MVIANSDSNTTLVSLNNNNNKHYYDDTTTTTKVDKTTGLIQYVVQNTTTSTGRIPAPSSTDGTPTELLISVVKGDNDNDDSDRMMTEETTSYVPLYLPSLQSEFESNDVNVDEYISRNYYGNTNNDDLDLLLLPGSNVLKESRNRLLCNNNSNSNTSTSS